MKLETQSSGSKPGNAGAGKASGPVRVATGTPSGHGAGLRATFRLPRNWDSFPAGAGGEPGARAAHARFWEGPGVNWTRIKYSDTTGGNGWTTGKTNRILNPRDPGLLTRRPRRRPDNGKHHRRRLRRNSARRRVAGTSGIGMTERFNDRKMGRWSPGLSRFFCHTIFLSSGSEPSLDARGTSAGSSRHRDPLPSPSTTGYRTVRSRKSKGLSWTVAAFSASGAMTDGAEAAAGHGRFFGVDAKEPDRIEPGSHLFGRPSFAPHSLADATRFKRGLSPSSILRLPRKS